MKYIPKTITEDVNVTPTHPLVNITHLLMTVMGVSCAIFFGLGIVANQIALNISPETEQKIGYQLSLTTLQEKEIKNDPRLPYLSKLVTSLYNESDRNHNQIELTVHVLDETQINAMVIPGDIYL